MRPVLIFTLFAARVFAADSPDLTERYRPVANQLIDAALADKEGYQRLEYLCYRIGNRLSGSTGLEKAIAWSVDQMKTAGLSNVRVIPVKVPHWVRGAESARMLAPADRPLHMLGLGGSIATPPGGITAEVVAVSDFDELEKFGRSRVEGKIVLYNQEYRGYGTDRHLPHQRCFPRGGTGSRRGSRALRDPARDAGAPHRGYELRSQPA